MIRKFILKFMIFFLPVLLLASITIAVGLYTGELLPIRQVIALQIAQDAQYYRSGTQADTIDYKLQMLLYRPADFLVLGSSRSQYLTEDIVTNPEYSFYNATIPAQMIGMLDMLKVLEEQDALPYILYMNIDLNYLNAMCSPEICYGDAFGTPTYISDYARLTRAFRTLALSLILEPQNIAERIESSRETPSGFIIGRKTDISINLDGSRYNNILVSEQSAHLASHEIFWANRSRMYESGSTVHQENLLIIQEIIELAETHDIVLIAVLPPYHPDFYARLQLSPDHSYFEPAREALMELFEGRDATLYDFSNPADSSIEADMFYDSWHLAELGSLQLYLDMLNQSPEILLPYSDPVILSELLENAPDSFSLNPIDSP